MAFFLVSYVAALVFSPVFPREQALAVHHIVFPLTNKLTSITPPVCAIPFHAIAHELTLKTASILPLEVTMSVLFAILVGTGIDSAIGPLFSALAIVLVIQPFTVVLGSINMEVGSLTV